MSGSATTPAPPGGADPSALSPREAAFPVTAALIRRPLALFGIAVIVTIVLLAIFAPLIAPYDPAEQRFEGLTLEGAPLPPNAQFLLGTDLLGRDLLSRLLYGARTSLVIGIVANGIAVAIGALVGITAGFFRGWIGGALMRFTDLMMAFPALLLAIVLAAMFQPSLWIVALVIALVNWVQIARVIYTETRSLARTRVHRGGARARRRQGAHPLPPHPPASHLHDHRVEHARHLHDRAPGSDALLPRHRRAAADAFVGQHHLREPDLLLSAPWLVFIPGGCIVLLALAFNLLGDALREVLDPTQKGRY